MKKTLSLVLIVASLMSLIIPTTSLAIENGSLPKEELGLLNALSLMREDGFSENAVLTRAEFCDMICSLFKYDNYASSEMPFRDIDSSHPYYKSVSALYSKGAVKGLSKYIMAPNKSITLGEAGVIAVSALGYDKAPEAGLTTYYSQASELGIFDGISAAQEDGLTEEMAVKMMYNILFAPIMTYQPDGEGISYSIDKDVLMMSEIYDMYEIKGVITENGVTSFYGESSIGDNEIKLGDEVYINGMEGLSDMLGYAVKAYVRREDKDDEGTVIYAYADERRSSDLEIMSDDINSADKTQIDYNLGDKSKRVKISKAADVVYNGIGVESFDSSTLNPVYGKLKLVDNDGDSVYDVIFVTDYKEVVVQNVSNTDKELIIYDKCGHDFSISYEKVACSIAVWRKDSAAKIEEIKSGDVLLIADSEERSESRIVNIYLSANKITGTLKGVNEEEITVDSTVTDVTPFLDLDAAKSYVSKTVTVYLDIYGNAIYITVGSGGMYGFLFKASKIDGLDDKVQVKILNTDNEWKTYILRDKVRNNGRSQKAEELYSELMTLDSKGEPSDITQKQLVRYEVNVDGEINRLDIAADGTAGRDEDAGLREQGYFRKSLHQEDRQFAHQISGLFEGRGYNRWLECFFAGDLPVLVRPDSNDITEKDVLFYSKSYFKTDNSYVCEGYDLTEENYISVVVVYGDPKAEVDKADRFVVVDRIEDELNEDDEVVRRLYGWSNGSLVSFEAEDENAFIHGSSEVKRGDIVRFAKNFGGKVESVEKRLWFRVDGKPDNYFTDYTKQGTNESDAYGYNQVAIGRVDKVYGNYLRIKVKNDNYINVMLRDAAAYVLYDESNSRNILSKGSKNDLTVGSVVVARLYFGRLDDIVVYKFR